MKIKMLYRHMIPTILGLFILTRAVLAAVPHPPAEVNLPIQQWWVNHPCNPEGKNYQDRIDSSEPILELYANDSINQAIARLPLSGGTIKLGPGAYEPFEIQGRNNIQIISDANAIIKGSCRLGMIAEDKRKSAGPAVAPSSPKVRKIYLRGLNFSGQLRYKNALEIGQGEDIFIDDCSFSRFLKDKTWLRYNMCVIKSRDCQNIWIRRCKFMTSNFNAPVEFDSCRDCGLVDCYLGYGYPSGVYGRADYLVMYKNVFNGNGNRLCKLLGQHVLILQNTRRGNIKNLVSLMLPLPTSDLPDNTTAGNMDIHILENRADSIEDACLAVMVLKKYSGDLSEIKNISISDNTTAIKQVVLDRKIYKNGGTGTATN